MCRRSNWFYTMLTLLFSVTLATSAFGVQDPPGCNANTLSLTLNRSTGTAVPGETVRFTVFAAVPAVDPAKVPACNTVNVDVIGRCPDATGQPVPPDIVLATNQSYPAGTISTEVGTFTCVMPDVAATRAVTARAIADGLLLDTDQLPGSDFTRQNDITVTVTPCSVQVDKQISCDGVNWFDVGLNPPSDGALGPVCLGTTQISVRYQARNSGSSSLFECSLTETNPLIDANGASFPTLAAGQTSAFVPAELTPACRDAVVNEPDTATVTCRCTAPTNPQNITRTASDTATLQCANPSVTVDKQVSCDGGTTWVDQGLVTANGDGTLSCAGFGDQPIRVRYQARNTGDVALTSCSISESNGLFGGPVSVGSIATSTTTSFFPATNQPLCDAAKVAEPNTATITCNATVGGQTVPVTAFDTARFTCETCAAQIDKQISCDGVTWFDQGFADGIAQGPTCLATDTVRVRYVLNNTGTVPVSCSIGETNGAFGVPPGGPFAVDGGQQGPFIPGGSALCTSAKPGEPDTGSTSCTCSLDGVTRTVTDNDRADLACVTPSVLTDRAVTCQDGTPAGNVDSTLVAMNNDGTNGCTTLDGKTVSWQYQARNSGTVPVYACVLTETNSLVFGASATKLVGTLAPGQTVSGIPANQTQQCRQALENSEPGRVDLNCCSVNVGAISDCPDANRVSAFDISTVTCRSPGLNIETVCVDDNQDGIGEITTTVTDGSTNLGVVNCDVVQSLHRNSATCAGASEVVTMSCIDPEPFSLAPGASNTCSGTTPPPPITSDSCTNATVTCDNDGVPGTQTASDQAVCPAPGLGCFTHTPGFWGTHPRITEMFNDNVVVCGNIPVNTTVAFDNNSAVEAMCSVGNDGKLLNPQGSNKVQLVRQCTAAYLNIAATNSAAGSCATEFPGIDQLLAACCQLPVVCTTGLLTSAESALVSSCIPAIDAFNNSPDTLAPFGPFVRPGPADSSVCQAAKNNGCVVRTAECR